MFPAARVEKVMERVLASAQQATKQAAVHQEANISGNVEGEVAAHGGSAVGIGSATSGASPDEYFISSLFLDFWHALSPDSVATSWKMKKMPPRSRQGHPLRSAGEAQSRDSSTSSTTTQAGSQGESPVFSPLDVYPQAFPWFIHFLGPKPWQRPSESLREEGGRALWLNHAKELCAEQPSVLAAFSGSCLFASLRGDRPLPRAES